MLADDDYSAIPRGGMHKDVHGKKEMQLKLSQQLLNCDDVKGGFDYVEAKDERKQLEGSVKSPRGGADTVEKIAAKFCMRG